MVLKPGLPPLPAALRPSAATIGSGGACRRPGNQEGDWATSLSYQLDGEMGDNHPDGRRGGLGVGIVRLGAEIDSLRLLLSLPG